MSKLDEIVDIFQFLESWEQRYAYLIELGEQLDAFPEEHKNEINQVKGCMSQVWVKADIEDDQAKTIKFIGDCDTSIIKGVLAVLIQLTSGQKLDAIVNLNVDEFFQRLELQEHLSPNRHFGIYAIVELMKKQASEITEKRHKAA